MRSNATLALIRALGGLVALAGLAAPIGGHAQTDPTAQARSLATSGRRAEALDVLRQRLAVSPGDTDARTLYGVIASWQSRWSEAREQLERVLAILPDHGDALMALINVELWSGNPVRAEALARDAIARRPESPQFVLARVRALRALRRDSEARKDLDGLLARDPGNKEARDLRERVATEGRPWELQADHVYEWFSDGRDPWRETSFSLRNQTRFGSLIGRYSTAERFDLNSHQGEIDFYPKFRPGTYAYLNAGYSRDATLYPTYRAGAEIYQLLGGGFEGSAGYRRLGFTGRVNLYTLSLGKYQGSWLFMSRAFLTPSSLGTSHTVLLSARRYFRGGGMYYNYVEVRYGFGAFPEPRSTLDAEVLTQNSFRVDLNRMLGRRWSAAASFGYSREDRLSGIDLRHYLVRGSLYFMF